MCVPEEDEECAALSLPVTLETDLSPDLEPGSGPQALVGLLSPLLSLLGLQILITTPGFQCGFWGLELGPHARTQLHCR